MPQEDVVLDRASVSTSCEVLNTSLLKLMKKTRVRKNDVPYMNTDWKAATRKKGGLRRNSARIELQSHGN